MEYNIGNNDHHIGSAKVHVSSVKKFSVAAAVGFIIFTTIGCHSEKEPVDQISGEPHDYTYSYEPRYNDVLYEVKWGDTLSEIVAAYESDYNKIIRYVDEIERKNKIKGILREGITIELHGVPESKLADYGYTSDYSVVGYDKMVADAYDWLIEEKEYIYESDLNRALVDKFNVDFTEFVIQYNDYIKESDVVKKAEKLDSLVELLNEVLEQFKTITGLNFDHHHKAYPIPEEIPKYESVL